VIFKHAHSATKNPKAWLRLSSLRVAPTASLTARVAHHLRASFVLLLLAAVLVPMTAKAQQRVVLEGWLEYGGTDSNYPLVLRADPGGEIQAYLQDRYSEVVASNSDYVRVTAERVTDYVITPHRFVIIKRHPSTAAAPEGLSIIFDPGRFSEFGGSGDLLPVDTDKDGTPDSEDHDDDGDGMSDDYELANGLQRLIDDAGLDKDSDGQSNFEEFLWQTVANDASSRFSMSVTEIPETDDVSLSWQAVTGRIYSILYTPDLVIQPVSIRSPITVPTNQFYNETLTNGQNGFYILGCQLGPP
jgi:hypothetical protein